MYTLVSFNIFDINDVQISIEMRNSMMNIIENNCDILPLELF